MSPRQNADRRASQLYYRALPKFLQSQSQIHSVQRADDYIPLHIRSWNSCPNLAATPCMENHFPDGIMAGCGRRRKARDIEQRSVDDKGERRARARTVIIKCIREVFRNERVSSQPTPSQRRATTLSHNLGRLFLANISNREVQRNRKTQGRAKKAKNGFRSKSLKFDISSRIQFQWG